MQEIVVTINRKELENAVHPPFVIADLLRQAGIPITKYADVPNLAYGAIHQKLDPETDDIVYTWRDS